MLQTAHDSLLNSSSLLNYIK